MKLDKKGSTSYEYDNDVDKNGSEKMETLLKNKWNSWNSCAIKYCSIVPVLGAIQ